MKLNLSQIVISLTVCCCLNSAMAQPAPSKILSSQIPQKSALSPAAQVRMDSWNKHLDTVVCGSSEAAVYNLYRCGVGKSLEINK
jgi:hypothetical protein